MYKPERDKGTMPYKISIPLTLADDTVLQKSALLRPWHAMFYTWLGAGNGELARQIHDQAEPKPFTLGFLQSQDAQHFRLPVTLLDDALWATLEQGLSVQERCVVQGQTFLVGKEPQVEQVAYERLWVQAADDPSIAFRFLTPTSFHTQGHHYPFPDPFLVFQSYLLRWNRFVPAAMQINVSLLDAVNAHVVVADYHLHTKNVDFGGYRQVGCLGMVRYQVLEHERLGQALKQLNVLADYAPFSGTGHKTTQGMGQTVRVRRPRRAKNEG